MPTRVSNSDPEHYEDARFTEDTIEDCARKIVQHLERNIVLYRHCSEQANRMACMRKYIEVTYILDKKSPLGI